MPAPAAIAIRCLALAATAALVAGCGGKPPGPTAAAPAADPLPEMPADHPPMTGPAMSQGPALPPATVMARVGDDVVTAGEVDAAVRAVVGPERYEYTSPAPLRELVEALVDRKLMARAARAAGIDREAATLEQLAPADASGAPAADQVLADAWLERQLAAIPPATDAAIARYYGDHAADFTVPARARVTRVVTQGREGAEAMRRELARGATADEILERHADAIVSAESLWLQDAAKKTGLVAVALALAKGEVSAVVPVAAGFAVMRADETAPARLEPLAKVRDGIAANLATAARQAALPGIRARLRKGVPISIVDAALLSYLAPAPAPP